MAKAPLKATAGELASADDDKLYRVKVSNPMTVNPGDIKLSPLSDNMVRGRVLKSLPPEAVVSFDEVVERTF